MYFFNLFNWIIKTGYYSKEEVNIKYSLMNSMCIINF